MEINGRRPCCAARRAIGFRGDHLQRGSDRPMNGDRTEPPPQEETRPGLAPAVWVPALMLIVALVLYAAG